MYHPWILERCKEVQANPNGYLDLWSRAHYKDIDVNTPVLTTKGWVQHGELKPGDYVYSNSGNPVKVIAIKPFDDSQCYTLTFCNNITITAGAGHLWEVEYPSRDRVPGTFKSRISCGKRTTRKKKLLTTEQLFNLVGKTAYRIGIRLAKPLQNPDKELPIHPYILGAWLGDGYSEAASICGIDQEIFNKIQECGYELGPRRKIEQGRHENYRVHTIKGLSTGLRQLNLIKNKHIPEMYFNASESQRRELLWGLMDTDGNIASTRNCTATYVSSRYDLARQVQTLAISLGYKARITPMRTVKSWQVCFQVFSTDKHLPCTLTRKTALLKDKKQHLMSKTWYISSITPTDTVLTNCIQVDSEDGVYLVGKQLIPTHNSTIITFGLTIKDILASHGDDPLPEWHGVEPTFGIFSHTRPIAKAFLAQIKQEFEQNNVLRGTFPDVVWDRPERDSPRWSLDGGIILRRKSNPKESTVDAWGLVDGQPTSKHYKVLIYDDVVTLESVTTPEMIKKTTGAYEMSLNLGSAKAYRRMVGTRYHFNDSYRTIIDRESAIPRIHKAITLDGDGREVPVLLSIEDLKKKRKDMGPYVYAAQMLLDPVGEGVQVFKQDWINYHLGSDGSGMNIYILVDPAGSKTKESDYTVMAVIGLSIDNNYYLLDMVRDRLSLKEKAQSLFYLHKKWHPREVRYEKTGLCNDIEYIKQMMNEQNYRFAITEFKPTSGSKEFRIKKLQPIFEEGRFWIPQSLFRPDSDGKTVDLVSSFIYEEFLAFPFSVHDDMLDAMAQIVDENYPVTWPKPVEQRERYSGRKKVNRSAWSA